MFTRFFDWITSRKVLRVVVWTLHILVVILVTLGLYAINWRYHLETELLSPLPELYPYWLPLLFLLMYVGAWFGYWFFRLLTDPRDGSHPDIDDAWAEGLKALDAAGIDPTEVPLFVVIGKPRTDLADFFAATRLPFAVRAEPRALDAPVQVYATRDAVFVVCPGASVLCRLADILVSQTKAATPAPRPAGFDLLDSPQRPLDVLPGDAEVVVPEAGGTQVEALGEWLPRPGVTDVPAVPTDEAARLAGRLKYLCRLIAERRRPFCPANGIVWLIPVAGTASEAIADRTAAACRADLLAAEAGPQVHCPAAAVVCDAQDLPGFRDLLRGLPDQLARERAIAWKVVPVGARGSRREAPGGAVQRRRLGRAQSAAGGGVPAVRQRGGRERRALERRERATVGAALRTARAPKRAREVAESGHHRRQRPPADARGRVPRGHRPGGAGTGVRRGRGTAVDRLAEQRRLDARGARGGARLPAHDRHRLRGRADAGDRGRGVRVPDVVEVNPGTADVPSALLLRRDATLPTLDPLPELNTTIVARRAEIANVRKAPTPKWAAPDDHAPLG